MDQEVYQLLCDCEAYEDAKTWNTFRRKNRKKHIDLCHAYLSEKTFKQFNFKGIDFTGADLSQSTFEECAMEKCHFEDIRAFGIKFIASSLVSSSFYKVSFSTAKFIDTDLRYVNFAEARLHQSLVEKCQCMDSLFQQSSIKGTDFIESNFSHSDFTGAEILSTVLNSSNFMASIVSGDTIFWNCYYDKKTDFTGVGLAGCRIEPSLLSSFQCNIRRIWWSNWYEEKKKSRIQMPKAEEHKSLSSFLNSFMMFVRSLVKHIINGVVKLFWWTTDYGSSTIRLLSVFVGITLFFAGLYLLLPHVTNDVLLNESEISLLSISRAIYFAVIIMTSVGFGDISAAETSILGHVVMLVQALIGYILLGAFLVRIGILFQGEFPVSQTKDRPKDDRNI